MDSVLAIAARPKCFDDVIGQDVLIKSIQGRITKNRMPKAWLFSGLSGGGKTTIARIVAVSLQMADYKDFGSPSADMMSRFSSYDIREINAALHNKVEDIEAFIEHSVYQPSMGSRYRVYIFDEAHRITTQAQQLLLKPTEAENYNSAIWIFCTTEPGKLNLTLKRRCARYEVAQLTPEGIKLLLRKVHKQSGLSVEQMRAFFDAAKNADIIRTPGIILQALESFAASGDLVSAFIPDGFKGDVYKMVQAMVKGSWPGVVAQLGDGKMTSESARGVRALAGGFLRTMLLKAGTSGKGVAIARIIDQFAETARTFDDSLLPVHVISVLYQGTLRFKKEKGG